MKPLILLHKEALPELYLAFYANARKFLNLHVAVG